MGRAPFVDRLLLWLFQATGTLLLVQGLAVGCAVVAVLALAAGPEVWRAIQFVGLLSTVFIAAALLIAALRRRLPARLTPYRPGPTEAMVFTMSLLTIAATSGLASAGLPALWRDIGERLSAIGFWTELGRSSQFGGIVLLPVLVALAVPVLVTGAAAYSLGFSLVLLARLRSLSPAFPTIAATGAILQSALVGGSWLATAALRQASALAATSASNAPDVEVRELSGALTAATAVLTTTTTLLVAPTLLLAGWAIVLLTRQVTPVTSPARSSQPPAATSARPPVVLLQPDQGSGAVVAPERTRPVGHPVGSPHPIRSTLPQSPVGMALAALGIAMLLFSGADRLRARPEYVTSTPEPGASSAAPPRAVRVTLSRPLDPASTLSLAYVPVEPSLTDISRDVDARSQVLTTDPRTLELIPPALGRGLYLVRWVAYPESGGVTRMGSLAFGVNAPVPPDGRGTVYALTDRDAGSRGRRYADVGGLLLLTIGALAWFRESIPTP